MDLSFSEAKVIKLFRIVEINLYIIKREKKGGNKSAGIIDYWVFGSAGKYFGFLRMVSFYADLKRSRVIFE